GRSEAEDPGGRSPEGLREAKGAIRLTGLRTEDLRDWTRARGPSPSRVGATALRAEPARVVPRPRRALHLARGGPARLLQEQPRAPARGGLEHKRVRSQRSGHDRTREHGNGSGGSPVTSERRQ